MYLHVHYKYMYMYVHTVPIIILYCRILKIDKDSLVSKSSHRKGVPGGKLILVNVSKPHTRPVTAMAIDHEGKLLATAVSKV